MPDEQHVLSLLGWGQPPPVPDGQAVLARVAIVHGSSAEVYARDHAAAAGWSHRSGMRLSGDLPVTPVAGDWVWTVEDEVRGVLPRRTSLTRTGQSGQGIQVLAANIDTVIVTVAVDRGINTRLTERLMVMAWGSDATPVLVLTKIDACEDPVEAQRTAASLAPSLQVLCTSSVSGEGLDQLRAMVGDGTTATLLGASGVGKTSLLNRLTGRDERVAQVARDGEGRHTTTTRRLYMLPGGGVLVDIPGIRSLDLTADEEAVDEVFTDIADLAARCRFGDCTHAHEPGCAVRRAVATGDLSDQRLDSWNHIQRELAHHRRKNDPAAMAEEKAYWKNVTKEIRRRSRA